MHLSATTGRAMAVAFFLVAAAWGANAEPAKSAAAKSAPGKSVSAKAISAKGGEQKEEAPPLVWGYGNRRCSEYLLIYPAPNQPQREDLVAEYQSTREWVSGFATGLSLATGMDILHGGNVDEVMERLFTQCGTQISNDLFNVALGVFRAMSTEKLDPTPAK